MFGNYSIDESQNILIITEYLVHIKWYSEKIVKNWSRITKEIFDTKIRRRDVKFW